MKRFLMLILILGVTSLSAQENPLIKHFEAYYTQMKAQGDIQGIINAMTHLNVIAPSQARKDTLAYIYMSEGQHVQALNTIGYDKVATDSDIAVEVKAIALKAVKQPQLAVGHFEELFKRDPNTLVAYELAELNLQLKNLSDAEKHINYGLNNAKPEENKAFYETQNPYQVPLKSAFMNF